MKKSALVAILSSAILMGCAAPKPQPQQKIKLYTLFNKEQAEQQMADGNNTIKGSALMRQVSGGVVTCAGQTISVYPATTYAYERIRNLYGSDTAGTRNAFAIQNNPDPFETTDVDYQKYQKRTLCDTQGFFKFEKMADGEFFIVSAITWKANPNSQFYEGGWMMRKVKLSGGEVKEIVIAP